MTSRLRKALRSAPPALVLALLAWSGPRAAVGQTVFDPYNAAVGNYQNFATPTMPQNLALPGQARAALGLEKQAVYGNKVLSTPFERYMLDGFNETTSNSDTTATPGTARGSLGAGLPYYYQSTRSVDRSYVPNRQADRDFLAAREVRDRRFYEAIREKDPTKRARLLRRVNAPISSSELALERDLPLPPERDAAAKPAGPEAETPRPAGSFRISRSPEPGVKSPLATDLDSREPRPGRAPARMPMADEKLPPLSPAEPTMPPAGRPLDSLIDPLSRPGPSRPAPAAPSVSPSRRRPGPPGAPRRPLLPSETLDRNRTSTPPAAPR